MVATKILGHVVVAHSYQLVDPKHLLRTRPKVVPQHRVPVQSNPEQLVAIYKLDLQSNKLAPRAKGKDLLGTRSKTQQVFFELVRKLKLS